MPLARLRGMFARQTRFAVLSMSLTAASVAATPRVSRADDAPVSESPQRRWDVARERVLDDERPPGLETPTYVRPYASELAGAYIATPLLAVGIVGLLSATEADVGIAGVVLTTIVAAAPAPLVHLLNDQPARAGLAFLAIPTLFLGGTLVGTLAALAVYSAFEEANTDAELEDGVVLAHAGTILTIGAVMGLVAVTGWAIFDVGRSGRTSSRAARARPLAQIQLGVAPRVGGATAVLAGRF
jgi:hypothetical protein